MNRPSQSLPGAAEFGLLLDLTHPTRKIPDADIVSRTRDSRFDPALFLRMARWHRMIPQLHPRLATLDLPEHLLQPLKQANLASRQQHLVQSLWLTRISRALKGAHIDFILLKGIALSQQLYGAGSYRQTRDIDIMVRPGDVERSEAILTGFGFVRTFPHTGATPKQLRFLNRHKKDREYIHAKDRTRLELHWRLIDVDHPFNPNLDELLATTEILQLQEEVVPTLGGTTLWLYQCLHGSVSGWYRLRWLCDIAMLIALYPPDWQQLLGLADDRYATNSLLEAVGLACRIYDMPLPEEVRSRLATAPRVRRQIALSVERLTAMRVVGGAAYIRRIGFWAPAKTVLNYLRVHAPVAVNDFKRFPLPDRFFFAYYLLRPFSFVLRRLMPERVKSRK